ncbi:MAG: reverse transcriptase domain-containing protein [Bryobacteraceae bacterium]
MDERNFIASFLVLATLPDAILSIPGKQRAGRKRRNNKRNRTQARLHDARLVERLAAEILDDPLLASDSLDSDPSAVDGWTSLPSIAESLASAPPASSSSEAAAEAMADVDGADGMCLDFSLGNATEAQHVTQGDECLSEAELDRRAVQRAVLLLRQGHGYRALSALMASGSLADLDVAEERAKLRALHPQPDAPIPLCPRDVPEKIVSVEWMAAAMRSSDNGASPGLTGCGANYLAVLADDPPCVEALAFFIQQIVNNTLPAVVRTLLTTSILVSLKKDSSSRRPIAIGDVFYRLAARYVLDLVTEEGRRAMSATAESQAHQYGVGQHDGCTQVVQTVQHLLLCGQPTVASASASPSSSHPAAVASPCPTPCPSPATRPLACLSIDLSNAFNSIDRATVLRTLYSNHSLSPCWRTVSFAYGQVGLLLMRCDPSVADLDAFIESRAGVRQGDPLSPLLFCLTLHPVYSAVAKLVRAGTHAFVDDSHSLGTIAECWNVWQVLPAFLAPLGLSLNVAKCQLTCFQLDRALLNAEDAAAFSALSSAGLRVNRDSLRLLGSVVGADGSCVKQWLNDDEAFWASHETVLRRIRLMGKQSGWAALQRLTAGVMTNRLRAMAPAWTQEHAQRYDEGVLRVARHILDLTELDGSVHEDQIRAPASQGGFGLTSAFGLAPAAHLAGVACTLSEAPAFAAVWDESVPLPPDSPSFLAIDDSIRRIDSEERRLTSIIDDPIRVQQVQPSVVPANATTFVAHFRSYSPPSIQHAISHRKQILSHIARLKQAERLGGEAGQIARARWAALTVRGSSLWLQVLPMDPRLTLSDVQWRWSAWLRLGKALPPVASGCCQCEPKEPDPQGAWHALTCPASTEARIARHNTVLMTIAYFSRLLLQHPRVEPTELCADDDRRPDIQLDLPALTLLGDVTIVHPTAKSYLPAAANPKRGVEAVGDKSADAKDKLYKAAALALTYVFLPLVLYTYGGFHKSALQFIRLLGDAHDAAACNFSLATWRSQLMSCIAIAVQRYTARIMVLQDQRARAAALPAHGKACIFATMRTRSRIAARRSAAAHAARDSPPWLGTVVLGIGARMAFELVVDEGSSGCVAQSLAEEVDDECAVQPPSHPPPHSEASSFPAVLSPSHVPQFVRQADGLMGALLVSADSPVQGKAACPVRTDLAQSAPAEIPVSPTSGPRPLAELSAQVAQPSGGPSHRLTVTDTSGSAGVQCGRGRGEAGAAEHAVADPADVYMKPVEGLACAGLAAVEAAGDRGESPVIECSDAARCSAPLCEAAGWNAAVIE